MLYLVPAMALLVSATPAKPFHLDTLGPAEGAESDCYTAFWPTNAKANADGDYPHIFEGTNNQGYIKIDGQAFAMTLGQGKGTPVSPAVYSALGGPTVIDSHVVTRVDKSPEGDTYHLKGTLTVRWNGQRQVIAVKGEDFCYSGGE